MQKDDLPPAGLLMGYQIRREHAYLLDRLSTLEKAVEVERTEQAKIRVMQERLVRQQSDAVSELANAMDSVQQKSTTIELEQRKLIERLDCLLAKQRTMLDTIDSIKNSAKDDRHKAIDQKVEVSGAMIAMERRTSAIEMTIEGMVDLYNSQATTQIQELIKVQQRCSEVQVDLKDIRTDLVRLAEKAALESDHARQLETLMGVATTSYRKLNDDVVRMEDRLARVEQSQGAKTYRSDRQFGEYTHHISDWSMLTCYRQRCRISARSTNDRAGANSRAHWRE